MNQTHLNQQPLRIINVPLELGAAASGSAHGPAALQAAGLSAHMRESGRPVDSEVTITIPRLVQPVMSAGLSEAAKGQRDTIQHAITDVCQRLADATQASLAAGCLPLVIGGDHSLAMGSIAGVARHLQAQQKTLGVIWFDAHADIHTPESSLSGNWHGMPLAHLLGYGDPVLRSLAGPRPALQGRHVVIIGARDIEPGEYALIESTGVTVISMATIRQIGMVAATQQALAIAGSGTHGIHLSFDVDGCDPVDMPGTGLQVAGGIPLTQTLEFIRTCAATRKICSVDAVELNPNRDINGQTALNLVALLGALLTTDAGSPTLPQRHPVAVPEQA